MADEDINLFEDDFETEEAPQEDGDEDKSSGNYVSVDEYNKLQEEFKRTQAEVESARQFKEDLAKVAGGNQNYDPGADYLTKLASDPSAFVQDIVNQSVGQFREEMRAHSLAQEYQTKYPELKDYADYVRVEAEKVAQEFESSGKQIDNRAVLDEAVNRFQNKFNKGLEGKRDQEHMNGMRRQVMNLNASNVPVGKVSPEQAEKAIWDMPDDKFEAEVKKLQRRHYQF